MSLTMSLSWPLWFNSWCISSNFLFGSLASSSWPKRTVTFDWVAPSFWGLPMPCREVPIAFSMLATENLALGSRFKGHWLNSGTLNSILHVGVGSAWLEKWYQLVLISCYSAFNFLFPWNLPSRSWEPGTCGLLDIMILNSWLSNHIINLHSHPLIYKKESPTCSATKINDYGFPNYKHNSLWGWRQSRMIWWPSHHRCQQLPYQQECCRRWSLPDQAWNLVL